MAQPNENATRKRGSESTLTNTTRVRKNGVTTKEVTVTKAVDGELIYKNDKWNQQETKTEETNNL